VHVITERSLGGDDRSRGALALAQWATLEKKDPPEPAQLRALLSIHREEPLAGTCLHLPELGYGTRSSLVLLLASELTQTRVEWAEGSPCTARWKELSGLLGQLYR
jgi:hypothetical protein